MMMFINNHYILFILILNRVPAEKPGMWTETMLGGVLINRNFIPNVTAYPIMR